MAYYEKNKLARTKEHRPKSMLGHLFENESAYFFANIQDFLRMTISVFDRFSLELASYKDY
jgi:hypothetical protein